MESDSDAQQLFSLSADWSSLSITPEASDEVKPDASRSVMEDAISRVHLGLDNPDILERIFEHFEDQIILDSDYTGPVKASTRRDLLSASLTSRAFFEPAMNVLWRYMDTLLPIFYLFPTLTRDENGERTLDGIILKEHLQRVLFYSRRIRSIEIRSPTSHAGIPDHISSIIVAQLRELKPLLPLTRLSVSFCDTLPSAHLNTLLLLTPPTISELTLHGISNTSEIKAASLMQTLTVDGKSLSTLDLSGRFTSTIYEALRNCTHLEFINLNFTSSQISSHLLQSLPVMGHSLKYLTMTFDGRSSFEEERASSTKCAPKSTTTFDTLSRLILSGSSAMVGRVLGSIQAPFLDAILVCCWSTQPEADTVEAEFASVVQKCMVLNGGRADNLRHVSISHTNAVAAFDYETTFASLKACRNIQSLNIDVPRLKVTSRVLSNFLKAGYWANLSSLQLHFKHPSTVRGVGYGLTAHTLVTMAAYCPNLVSAQIPLDGTMKLGDLAYMRSKVQYTPRKNHALKTLSFQRLPHRWDFSMTLAIAFAGFLDHLFPSLRDQALAGGVPERGDWWTGVMAMMAEFRRIRAAERALVLGADDSSSAN